ncbi:MAG: geranylgeranylglycerol-phosphate geranylgeranyltransferase [Bacteroidota bacterium]
MTASARNIGGFIIASRVPNLLIIGYTQFATGYFLLGQREGSLQINFVLFLISTALISAGGYIINDYFDQKVDMINKPDKVVVGTALRRRLALAGHLLLTISGIVLGFLLDPLIGAIHSFSSISLWMYSGYLKRIVLIDTLLISFLTSLSMLMIMVYFRDFKLIVVAYALFGFVTIFIRESIKDIVSAKGERIFGLESVATSWGVRGAKWLILICCVGGVVGLIYYLLRVPNQMIRYLFVCLFPIVIYAMWLLQKADKVADFKKIRSVLDIIIFIGLGSICFLT